LITGIAEISCCYQYARYEWLGYIALSLRSYAKYVVVIIISSLMPTITKKAKTYKQVIGYLEKPINVTGLRSCHQMYKIDLAQ